LCQPTCQETLYERFLGTALSNVLAHVQLQACLVKLKQLQQPGQAVSILDPGDTRGARSDQSS